jgi:hypothetical protein
MTARKLRSYFHNACLRTWFYLLDRLGEASTLRGIVAGLAGAVSWLKPERVDAIVGIALLAIGLLGVLTPDTIKKQKRALDKRDAAE